VSPDPLMPSTGPAAPPSLVPDSTARDATVANVARYLAEQAPSWFPALGPGPARVQLLATTRRTASDLHVFVLGAPSDARARREVVVKVPRLHPEVAAGLAGAATPRPRVLPRTPTPLRPRLEYEELRRVEQLVAGSSEPGIGAIRALGHLPQSGAIVMERIEQPTLHRAFLAAGLGRMPDRHIVRGFRNAGIWLRHYHGSTNETALETNATRAEVLDIVQRIGTYVEQGVGDRIVTSLVRTVAQRAEQVLPETLSVAPTHGDFGLPNLFLGADGRVTAFDMVGRWRAPIHQDLASLLTSLRTSRPLVLSHGRAIAARRLHRCETAFLAGYAGTGVLDLDLLRLFEMLAHLDKWAHLLARMDRSDGSSGPSRWQRSSTHRYLAQRIGHLLAMPVTGRPVTVAAGRRDHPRPEAPRRGPTVALIGPDGAGKSTVSERLPALLGRPAHHVYMGINLEASNLLLPTTRLLLEVKRWRGGRPDLAPPGPEEAVPGGGTGRTAGTRTRAKTVLRISNLIAEEWFRHAIVRWHQRRGEVVILDRHFLFDYFDRDVAPVVPVSGVRRLHGYLLRERYPRPDLTIVLDAPGDVLFARKGEGCVESLERRRQRYLSLLDEVPRSAVVDATRPVEDVLHEVAGIVRHFERDR
jgi:thymidylate kinase